ncbi:hypothetical protein [Halobacillus sp. H74]|uniref:hypothetical protein n=1 Tax=Halobacillus sp. H74 TaxID=3457436 RepID=UPI003FCCA915
MNGFWIGVIVAVIALLSFFLRDSGSKTPSRWRNTFTYIGIVAATVGIIGYFFLGWRF